MGESEVRVVDLFCGIGGFRYGLERSNRQQQENSEVSRCGDCSQPQSSGSKQPKEWGDYTCVYANDNDKYACQIYRKHWGDKELYEGDIRTVDPATIPEHDIICAGFPCQSFSIAGKRGGFEDIRGTLFFEIMRIARAKRTPYLLLENVKGLLSHDEGDTFQTILRTMDELGYDCQWQVLNSKNFGVPQNRERVFIIGHLRGQPRPKVFPIGETDNNANKPELNYIGAIMSEQNQKWLEDGKVLSRNFPQGQRVYSTDGIASNICGDAGGLGGKTGLYEIPPVAQALQTDGQLRQGVSWGTDKPQAARNIRRLTPKECERLQGFPDGWTEKGIDVNGKEVSISDTQRYKTLGNAVSTPVITAIGERLWHYQLIKA